MSKPYEHKKWKAAALAKRVTTAKQATTRCKELKLMITKHERKIEKENIRISKHLKEIRLLESKWKIGSETVQPEQIEIKAADQEKLILGEAEIHVLEKAGIKLKVDYGHVYEMLPAQYDVYVDKKDMPRVQSTLDKKREHIRAKIKEEVDSSSF
jgi:hypothetical protein